MRATAPLYFVFVFVLSYFSVFSCAAHEIYGDTTLIVIKDIKVEGIKRTRPQVVLRELSFSVGDTLSKETLANTLQRNQNQVYNTGLFNAVVITLKRIGPLHYTAIVTVTERWYVFPIPILELADRNFNVWWEEMNRDPGRINYGVRFYQENMTGRNDRLKTVFQFGYTQKFELFYDVPYIDHTLKNGLEYSISFSQSHELPYAPDSNKLLFYKSNEWNRQRFYTGLMYKRRNALFNRHELELLYHQNKISNTVARLNPDFFLDGRRFQRYFKFRYQYTYDKRDLGFYPLNGQLFRVEVIKSGLGIFNDINMAEALVSLDFFRPLGKKFYFSGYSKLKFSLPVRQPYFNQRGFGYRIDFVRGYELYVIDGQQFALLKTNLKYQLLQWNINFSKIIPAYQFSSIPIEMYLKIHGDIGYVMDRYYHQNNPLNNELQTGFGAGVDVASFYDMVLSVEYSVNRMLEKGLFLHFRVGID